MLSTRGKVNIWRMALYALRRERKPSRDIREQSFRGIGLR
jgi:hypothetical protein